MSYKLAVCDDNQTDSSYISTLVTNWALSNGYMIKINTFPSAEAFLFHYADEKDYDILMLDIKMDRMDGMELAKKIRKSNTMIQIIFITGFPDFMAEGYEVCALHYLMKPVSPDKLYATLERAVKNLAKKEKTLQVVFDRQTDFIPLSEILYIESQKQYVIIHTTENKYRMKCSLTEIMDELNEYFFKCQRSFIVNLFYVAKIKADCVILKDGEEVPISRGMSEIIAKMVIKLF